MSTQKPSFTICSLLRTTHKKGYVLVLDVGTSSVKAFVFDGDCQILAKVSKVLGKLHPRRGWVEQDPEEIIRMSTSVLRAVVKKSGVDVKQIRAMGITNQREATVMWDRRTGKPLYPVIGWEDTRTRSFCRGFSKEQITFIQQWTGLVVDAYFSASKIRWLLSRVPGARALAEEGYLACGTIDSWLLWKLCEGHPHVTDETNASRTLLFDIRKRLWHPTLLSFFDVPRNILPHVFSSRASFGILSTSVLDHAIPIRAICGDQQASSYAAMHGHRIRPGLTKVTFGTGVFLVQMLGHSFRLHPSFMTTLVPSPNAGAMFALEGKIEGSAARVNELLRQKQSLVLYLTSLAKKVKTQIDLLPTRPRRIVVDGGVARDGIVVEMLQQMTGIQTCLQPTFDGTALGIALLLS